MALGVVDVAAQTSPNGYPTRVLGVPNPNVVNLNPNFVEGRELYQPLGVALDNTVSPPILYVADSINNRILAWRNSADQAIGVPADLVVGQRDFTSTTRLGPGTSLPTGLAGPSGLAVDGAGNLWVVDAGNNRLLRFPKPFDQKQTGAEVVLPDIAIGQASFDTRGQNWDGSATPNERGLSLATPARVFHAAIAFDGAGNLWISDPNNHRVLRFPVAALTASGPPADLVIGQVDFISRVTAAGTTTRTRKDVLNTPNGVAIDGAGRLYVADGLSRVLVYEPDLTTGKAASRIAGVVVTGGGQPAPPATPINNISLGVPATGTTQIPPEGVAIIGGTLAVVDVAAHRIVRYPAYEQWPVEATQFSPTMNAVIGQNDFTSGRGNSGQSEPSGTTFFSPIAVASTAAGDEIFVADAGNNRVVRRIGASNFPQALQTFGQLASYLRSPNLVEGREFFFFDGFSSVQGAPGQYVNGTGMAFDGARFYVADTLNHRVLGFKDYRSLQNGNYADIVIGQQDIFRTLINAPSGDVNTRTDTGLFGPSAVAVDANGDLYVVDSGNGRVLRFPRPFDQPAGTFHKANLVLGQPSFTARNTAANESTMSRPFGIAIFNEGSIAVSDALFHRVLLFKPNSGNFVNGQAASTVFGQQNFTETTLDTAEPRRLSTPRGLSLDGDQRLYVADAGKSRIAIYDNAPVSTSFPFPTLEVTNAVGNAKLRYPNSVYVAQNTGEIWVANTANTVGQILRYPIYSQLVLNPSPNYAINTTSPPLGLAVDPAGAVFLADAANKVGIYHPSLVFRNAANFIATTGPRARALAPGMYVSTGALGVAFSDRTEAFSTVPMPTTLADTQVVLNGRPAPLHFVSPGQINFVVHNDAPSAGEMDVIVSRVSTGQILAAGRMPMGLYAPGFFANSGNGQLAATNQDGTVNSASNAAPRGSVITLYGTGMGHVDGAPPDGDVPGRAIPGPRPQVIMGTGFLPDSSIEYSGLAPSLIGVWQLNVKIPDGILPANDIPVAVVLGSIPSFDSQPPYTQRTTIAVR